MKNTLLFVAVLAISLFSQLALSCSCARFNPVLSAYTSPNLVAAKVLAYIEADEVLEEALDRETPAPLFMEVEITRHFRGEQTSGTVILRGDSGIDCRPYVTSYPIGTEWVIGFSQHADFAYGDLGGCVERLEIIEGSVAGFVRHRLCDKDDEGCHSTDVNIWDHPGYEPFVETFTLDMFDGLQLGFSHGLSTASNECDQLHSQCHQRLPYYDIQKQTLHVPYIDVTRKGSRYDTLGQIGATFSVMSDSQSGNAFEMTGVFFVAPD